MTRHSKPAPNVPGLSSETLSVKTDLSEKPKSIHTIRIGGVTIDLCPGRDTIWVIARRKDKGGIVLRTNPWPGPYVLKVNDTSDARAVLEVTASAGTWTIEIAVLDDKVLRVKVSLKPVADLLLAFWPRDLYVLDAQDDPTTAIGEVEAAQRGVNGGLCYFCVKDPGFGPVLYVQNLTALNPYFKATKTKPDGVVGGRWPSLGYQPPTSPMGYAPPEYPLTAGEEIVVSDALLAFRPDCAPDEMQSARYFVEMLAEIYPHLDKPEVGFHDWIERSQRTIKDLTDAPQARIEHYGHTYLHAYTDAEYPDSMVQLSVLASLREWELTQGIVEPLSTELSEGLGRFFDKELGTIRRYLPNVGDDKDADAVDSWYLFHPLMNLARLAQAGDKKAEKLFRDSLGYTVRSAQHFGYVWPIQFNITDFSVITEERSPQGRGQTDAGGLYAYVMLLAFEITGDETYLNEAKAALKALEGNRFNLAYQTNLTAWGAVACLKLWLMDRQSGYLDQSFVFIASFLHNCELWDSQNEHAQYYTNFFGVTCLHDAPYMAAYECFETFAAFDEFLRLGYDDIPPAAKLLLCEYRRFAQDLTWYFYPDALPEEAIAKDDIRNGYNDRTLSFPLEDLYGDGQPAGQVGQEIYGAGGAFIFATRAFNICGDKPFRLFCDFPTEVTATDDGDLRVKLQGPTGQAGRLRLMRKARRVLPKVTVTLAQTEIEIAARDSDKDFHDYDVPADATLLIAKSRNVA
ncbi:hypothetical protein [Asticcacaulis sp. YBE204]|uniref:hypothetical protein n=1 Tax=Asticcacaulis sp. YBE204 TaxID=1282363 RepID=UPI0003C3E9F0|nr:hypothetical protein [Asticcacaulis sp. YBE204]ESQ78733.1 hypothetical protein AEYBE204_12165 [Asticcacaulis sp. YBE204]